MLALAHSALCAVIAGEVRCLRWLAQGKWRFDTDSRSSLVFILYIEAALVILA